MFIVLGDSLELVIGVTKYYFLRTSSLVSILYTIHIFFFFGGLSAVFIFISKPVLFVGTNYANYNNKRLDGIYCKL